MDKVRESLGKAFGWIKDKWGNVSRNVRILIIAILSAIVVSVVTLIIIFSRTDYVVLYSNMSQEEMQSVVSSIIAMGYTNNDVQIKGTEVLVSSKLENTIRMNLSIQGYPSSTFNYNIWDTSIGMFSTDKEKAVKEQHQLQQLIMATLDSIPEVDSSKVIISMIEDDPFVISTGQDYDVKAMVMLTLKNGQKLTAKQIDGIYNLVMASVPKLDRNNISVTDGSGITLIAEDDSSGVEELALLQERLRIQKQFQNEIEQSLEEGLRDLLKPFIREFSVDVTATLDYGRVTEESKTYTPSVPEEGTAGGMIDSRVDQTAWGGLTAEGGVVGTEVEADITPDYPTLIADADTDVYYEQLREVNYKVNEVIRSYESGEFTLNNISASVLLDGNQLTQAEREEWQAVVANAIGTTVDFVSVRAVPRILQNAQIDVSTASQTLAGRNVLIFIIITLGAVLIVLFLLAIMTSGSKKKRQVRARLARAAAQAAAAGAPVDLTSSQTFGTGTGTGGVQIDPKTGEPIDAFNIASLIPDDGVDTRDVVLKREIRDFSAQNPDIVANLIRQWMNG